MQLEIKVIIDFGDDRPADMNQAFKRISGDLNTVVQGNCHHFGAKAATHIGWISASGDGPAEEYEPEDEPEDEDTYKILRFYQDPKKHTETVDTGLTRAEAQAHCSSPHSKGPGWFDGFERE